MEAELADALELLYAVAHEAWLCRIYDTGPLRQPAFGFALRQARFTLKKYHSSARPPLVQPAEAAESADRSAEPAAGPVPARPAPGG